MMRNSPKIKQLHISKLGANLCLKRSTAVESNLSKTCCVSSLDLKPSFCRHTFNMACLPTSHVRVQFPLERIQMTDRKVIWLRCSAMRPSESNYNYMKSLPRQICWYREIESRDHTHTQVCTHIPLSLTMWCPAPPQDTASNMVISRCSHSTPNRTVTK